MSKDVVDEIYDRDTGSVSLSTIIDSGRLDGYAHVFQLLALFMLQNAAYEKEDLIYMIEKLEDPYGNTIIIKDKEITVKVDD